MDAERLFKRLLSTKEAARYLSVSPSWLCKSRLDGSGPIHVRMGARIAYRIEDLDAFVVSRRRRSTSAVEFMR